MRQIKTRVSLAFVSSFFTGASLAVYSYSGVNNTVNWLLIFVLLVTLLMTFQGIITLIWMLYAWENPENVNLNKSPNKFYPPQFSFTAIVPARNEDKVIHDTLISINKIDYPEELKEVLIVCREDDTQTIAEVSKTITELGNGNIRLVNYSDFPINKPHALNIGLAMARNKIVTIFDAEDEPNPNIYKIINTVILRDQVDVVQSGVQLMNFRSHWFSALNVMEYYLWFKSGLHFFLKAGQFAPLGGNTVFFKKGWLESVNGWDENCLTEDADLGIRLTLAGAKTRIIYDEKHVTKEETPANIVGLVKQRTRWNQGFMQIIMKGDWTRLPNMRQRLVSAYVLLSPIAQAFFVPYTVFAVWIAYTQKFPVFISLLSFVPLYLFALQILVSLIGLFEFTRAYKYRLPIKTPFLVILSFIPYQLVLMFSSFRALFRVMFDVNTWEKTEHLNDHRQTLGQPLASYVR